MGARSGGLPEEINIVAMLEEVNQKPRNPTMESYKKLEQDVVRDPDDFDNVVVELGYPDPVDPTKLTNTEGVPIRFDATGTDGSGALKDRPVENIPPQSEGD